MAAPKVPKKTSIMGGMSTMAIGLEPSMTMERRMPPNARTSPMIVPGSIRIPDG